MWELKRQLSKDSLYNLSYNPILHEKNAQGGVSKGMYFHQDYYMAKKVFENKPLKHIDIGSRIDGFVSQVAVFREIEIFDIRPIESSLKNIITRKADLMKLPKEMQNYCDSLSSLNVIEHFGLGRYGDMIDSKGHEKAIRNIFTILKDGGTFYFSVPLGPQRIEFNAHRVFSLKYLIDLLEPMFYIQSFSYVNDLGDIILNPELSEDKIQTNFGCNFGCALFELKKYVNYHKPIV